VAFRSRIDHSGISIISILLYKMSAVLSNTITKNNVLHTSACTQVCNGGSHYQCSEVFFVVQKAR
jgi:hypothetical protein